MEKIVVFLDYANTSAALQKQGAAPDYPGLLSYLTVGRFLVEAHAYVSIDPRNPHGRDRQIEALWQSGWLAHTKLGAFAGESYKCDFDVEITLDLMRTAEIIKPDIIVLVSGDKDLVPVMLELRQRGIRVEVAAFLEGNAAKEVILKANGFIDLREYLEESQGVGHNDHASDPLDGEGDLASPAITKDSEEYPASEQRTTMRRPSGDWTGYPRPPAFHN
jgi:uncharacterized LabA/DUF88 family protein